jgi:site-specific DNA-methyltransferase (adenine-specific)
MLEVGLRKQFSRSSTCRPSKEPLSLSWPAGRNWGKSGPERGRFFVVVHCIGSGTTAAACEATGRRWIGIEMDQAFCEMTKERLTGGLK